MDLERAAMEGKLTGLKKEAGRLRLRIEGNCRAIRMGLNTALTPVDDLEVAMVAEQMDELMAAFGELQANLVETERVAKRLGGGY